MDFKMLDSSDHASVNIDLNLLTPGLPVSLRPLDVQDEDSGLGMYMEEEMFEDEEISSGHTPSFEEGKFNFKSAVRKSLFGGKRSRDNENNAMRSKRARCSEEGEDIAISMNLLSFKDISTPPRCDVGFVIEAVNKFAEHDDVTGNGSKTFCLPTISGKHSDLKSITWRTLSDLMNGHYDDVIGRYRIIDCRYPYEYTNGHIKGADNLYTNDMVENLLLQTARPSPFSCKSDILIFHCEFSSARGPRMCRLLRKMDRELNSERYPLLNFPEVYILHEGYKSFYHACQEQCEPMGYMPMLHSNHASDLRHFRSKSKSWCVGDYRKKRVQHRLSFSES